ncbi:MAG TPA: DUF1501 domain-containing protein [Verrucomicrobiae bacterium]|nr:DUF1501 domain-containing protein [Verrucomicrobiae bacterium]
MKTEPTFQTRRDFLRATLLGGAFSWTIPTFLANTLSALQAEAADKATQAVTGRDGPILVVLQMAGGNDGLNTVVPYTNDYYHRARPRIGLKGEGLLKLNDELALHPHLTGFKELYDAGRLAIVQGAGYPNPNRSHFRSTEIWQTASDSNRFERYGWLGRYFDNACAGCDPTVGVSVGRQTPQAFFAKDPMGISLENPQNYRFLPPRGEGAHEAQMVDESFQKLNQADGDVSANSGGSIGSIHGAGRLSGGSALDFLERTALEARVSSDTIREIASRSETQGVYPASPLGNSLKLTAKLIGGGLQARVFYLSQGGYDTHTNQVATQNRLLQDLGDSVRAFVDDMEKQGNLSRVLVMTFSEFGRRVAENASGGTDHGAAAPLFMIGKKLQAGLLGTFPSLAPGDLFQGDIRYTVDFRSVYASVLENWLKTPSVPILGRQFPLLHVV